MERFFECSRCGRVALERLRTHSYCWECNFSPEPGTSVEQWYALEYRRPKQVQHYTPRPDYLYYLGFRGIV